MQRDDAFGGLARGGAFLSCFQSVIGGIADHVHDRIAELFDDGLVDFGGLAGHPQDNRLAGLLREFAHQPRHALENGADRLRPDRHDAVLQVLRVDQQLRQFLEQPRIGVGQGLVDQLRHQGLRNGDFTRQIDQPVDAVEIDADGRQGRFGDGQIHVTGGLGRCRRVLYFGFGFIGQCRDFEIAIILDEFEDGANGLLARRRRQLQGPGEIGLGRVHGIECGQAGEAGFEFDAAQFAQLPEDQQRIVGPPKEAAMRPEFQPVGDDRRAIGCGLRTAIGAAIGRQG